MSRHTVVEHIASELAERRQRSLRLRPAYMALALAILADEEHAAEPTGALPPDASLASMNTAA